MLDNNDLVSPLPPDSPLLPAGVTGTPPLAGPLGEDWISDVTDPATGETVGATTRQLRAAISPPDLFADRAPAATQPGIEGQKYYHLKAGVKAYDLYQRESGAWALRIGGIAIVAGSGAVNAVPNISLGVSASSLILGQSFTLSATAEDSDGTITKVDFFEGAKLLLSKTNAPFLLDVTPESAGTKSYTATAYDNLGATRSTPAQSVQVFATSNSLPLVAITLSAPSAVAGSTVTISATANDPDGTVTKVEFFDSGTLIGTVTSAPYTITYAPGQVGNRQIIAKATDNSGGAAQSEGKFLNVTATPVSTNQLPTVSYAQSVNSIVVGQGMTLSATASDSDGTVAKVEFYQGGSKIGEATTAPYSIPFTPTAAGSFIMSAKATDNSGGTSTTQGLTLTVTAAPVLNVTPNPPSFTGFSDTQAGGTVTLELASGIPLSDYRVSLPGSTTFAAPTSATITVGNVAGTVRAYSVAASGRNQSQTASSPAFTTYTAPTTPTPATYTHTMTGPSAEQGPLTLTSFPGLQFRYNAPVPDTGPDPKKMSFFIAGQEVGGLDFPGAAAATPTRCEVVYNGTTYTKGDGVDLVFKDGPVTLTP